MTVEQYVVVGNPIEHSLSPQIHAHFAQQQLSLPAPGITTPIEYTKRHLELDGFAAFAKGFAKAGGKGMNITVPFKLDAFNYVDECDAHARAAGAVNTIAFNTDQGTSYGYNTDGLGLVRDLSTRYKVNIGQATILILGAGGAAQGVLLPLLELGPKKIYLVNRTAQKAVDVVQQIGKEAQDRKGVLEGFGYADLHKYLSTAPDIVINATSLGLADTDIPLAAKWVKGSFCYDMSYGANARFCLWAKQQHAAASVDGLGMLVEQAAFAFSIWRGLMPQTEKLYQELREQLRQ